MPTAQAIGADAPLDAEKGAPEMVQLLPAGKIEARDGRKFVLPDPQAVVAAFRQGGIDLPIDYEHQGDDPGRKTIPAASRPARFRRRAGSRTSRCGKTVSGAASSGRPARAS